MAQRKLTQSEKQTRTVKAVVPVEQRASAGRKATTQVKAKAAAYKK